MLINAYLVLHRLPLNYARNVDIKEFRLTSLFMLLKRTIFKHPHNNILDGPFDVTV